MFGSRVLFLLIVFKANLKASSSAPDGPLSMDSNIPPVKQREKTVISDFLEMNCYNWKDALKIASSHDYIESSITLTIRIGRICISIRVNRRIQKKIELHLKTFYNQFDRKGKENTSHISTHARLLLKSRKETDPLKISCYMIENESEIHREPQDQTVMDQSQKLIGYCLMMI